MGDSVDSVSDQENEQAMREVKHVVEEYGIKKLEEYFKSKLEGWRDVKVNFGITGDSGSGKSSFINSIRGLPDDGEGAAEVGITETTKVPTPYDHPTNPKIKFWDLPGIGSPMYPDVETFNRGGQLTKYDMFLIFTANRFTKNDSRLAREIKEIQKNFFFIRTKIDADVDNENRKLSPLSEHEMLTKLRQDASENLGKLLSNKQDIYLLSNHFPDKWDFDRLTQAIQDALPTAQKESITLSLGNVTRSIFTSKVEVLKSRLWKVAALSGVVAAVPVPGLSFAVDTGLILYEFELYRNQLGLPEPGSTHFASLDSSTKEKVFPLFLTTVQEVVKYMSARYVSESAIEEGARLIPYIGAFIAGSLSFSATYIVLKLYLEEVKNAVELCSEQALSAVKKID